MAKDRWDKWEIVGKVAGAVLIPFVIAIGGLYFNAQENQRAREAAEAASKRAATAQMMQIAVGVLTSEPSDETKALREWASKVLKNPGEVIAMNDEATVQLLATPLAKTWGGGTFLAMQVPNSVEELWKNLEQFPPETAPPNAPPPDAPVPNNWTGQGFEMQGSSPDE